MIIGVDEVGRGALVGSVVAGAVILSADFDGRELTDSKKLSATKREWLFEQITSQCRWAVAEVDALTIDRINILQATMQAMKQAVLNLNLHTDYSEVLIDGNQCPDLPHCRAIIKGDLSEPVISAASIVAKVWRDKLMIDLDKHYPQYGFAQHKGYGTKVHLQALTKFGAIDNIHRQSFAPVRTLITKVRTT